LEGEQGYVMGVSLRTLESFGGAVREAIPKVAHERMDRAKWVQTAIDLPLVIGATGLGYGVGRTLADRLGERTAREALRTGRKPGWIKHLPLATSIMGSVGSYALGRSRAEMRSRREEASRRAQEKRSGVEPAPQSRRIPPRDPNAPWRYDPRPGGWF